MDITSIGNAIGTLGFPIVCVIALGWFIYKAFEKFTEQSEKREEKLYTVVAEAQEQNKQLSKTNAEFVTVLSTYKSDLDEIKDDVTEIKSKLK